MSSSGNPWKDRHLKIERRFFDPDGGVPLVVTESLVDREYAGTDQYQKPCHAKGCNGTMHWQATVGALRCTTCDALAHSNGTPITKGEIK